jgi:hypothetical protein
MLLVPPNFSSFSMLALLETCNGVQILVLITTVRPRCAGCDGLP